MKRNIFSLKSIAVLFFLFHLFCTTMLGQTNDQNSDLIQDEIISQSLMYDLLWQRSTISVHNVTTFYVLNHGVDFNFSSNLQINNKSVVLINKGDIETLGNSPYFLFHTLNIETSKAFLRVYLSYVLNGERKTSEVEISFVKNNNQWEIVSDQL